MIFWDLKLERESPSRIILANYKQKITDMISEYLVKPYLTPTTWPSMAQLCCRGCLQGHCSLLIADYYSKFITAENVRNPQSETVINKCRNVCSQVHIPKKLTTVSGPEYSSHKFRSFSKTWDILHKSISPHYYQANCLAARSIQNVKQALNKVKLNSEEHFLAILS